MPLALASARQLRRALAHLRDRAGRRGQRLAVDGLDRVDRPPTAGCSASSVARIFSSWISASTRTGLRAEAEPARAQRDLRAALLAGDVEHLASRATARRAPAAAASTCRCPDRRRSAPRRRRRGRRRARGRARRCRSAGARRRRRRSRRASPPPRRGSRPRAGARSAACAPALGDRLDERVPGAAAAGTCPATSGWSRRTRCSCRSISPWPSADCRGERMPGPRDRHARALASIAATRRPRRRGMKKRAVARSGPPSGRSR